MKIWVTGAAGFVGVHLCSELKKAGYDVLGTDLSSEEGILALDICDAEACRNFVEKHQPEACVHLAGMSSVQQADEDKERTRKVNVDGAMNVLRAFPKNSPARLLFVTSSEVYGQRASNEEWIDESTPLNATNTYGRTKAEADQTLHRIGRESGRRVMTVRPANHTGPGQSESFVASSYARQVAERKLGLTTGPLRVGNLDSVRNFTDVRDVVRAYRLLLESDREGEAYNLASDTHVKVRHLLEVLEQLAGMPIETVQDETLYRESDPVPRLSVKKIEEAVGWKPTLTLEQTLSDLLNDWLIRLSEASADADSPP